MHPAIKGLFGLCVTLMLAGGAAAQQPQTVRIRGQIETMDGAMMSIKTRDGGMMQAKLADDARVLTLVKVPLANISKDSFVGIAGMPRPDGSIEAFSVHMFLPAQRGVVADRHGPWDARPNSTMTNAYVESTVSGTDGQVLTVKYKDGEQKVVITPATVIAAVAPGERSDVKPGAQVIIFAAQKRPDGSLVAPALYVGRDVTPAM